MADAVFDLETLKWFSDDEFALVPRELTIPRLQLALGCALVESVGDVQQCVYADPADAGYRLWERLCGPDVKRIFTFNGNEFDWPLLQFEHARYSGRVPQMPNALCVDIFDIIKRATGRWVSLDALARANLGRGKTGKGEQAARRLSSGDAEQQRQAIEYCLNDCYLLWELVGQVKRGDALLIPANHKRGFVGTLAINLNPVTFDPVEY